MADALSRISSKFQTVIPEPIRRRLGLKTGDVLRFRVSPDGLVTVEKAGERDDDPFVAFSEWRSEEDERLYSDL
jgi:antitoxin PrlF